MLEFEKVVDAPKALLGLTELNLGIIPGWGWDTTPPLDRRQSQGARYEIPLKPSAKSSALFVKRFIKQTA